MKAQNVDDGVLDVIGCNADGAILDVGMLLVAPRRLDTNGVTLIAARQSFDLARHRS